MIKLKQIQLLSIVAVFLAFAGLGVYAEDWTVGGGVHYWRTLKDVSDDDYDIERDGVAYMAAVQFAPTSLLKLEADLEIFPEGFGGSSDTTYAPQGYLIIGSGIFAGLGIGINYHDKWADKPFYVLRAGLNLELLPNILLEVNAQYMFVEWEKIHDVKEDVDTDTITLGAMIRVTL
ncbi:MAG: hypothetical protein EOM20_08290 [Spartobacteria bacterium]|nr:hypothetical protein [Spartobacteria bacterium]